MSTGLANKILKKLKEESTIGSNSGFVSGGEGENIASPLAFKGPYKYKISKKIKENDNTSEFVDNINPPKESNKKFIKERMDGFDNIEKNLNILIPLLQQAKHKTLGFYRQNPSSFDVLYGTDLANDYLKDLIKLFKD